MIENKIKSLYQKQKMINKKNNLIKFFQKIFSKFDYTKEMIPPNSSMAPSFKNFV